MTLILSVVSQKGGVGKSTVARSVAEFSTREGIKTLLADLDFNQKTSVNWSVRRKSVRGRTRIDARAFEDYRQAFLDGKSYEMMVVDTRGYADRETADICKLSDIALLPCGFSMDEKEPTFVTLNTLVRLGVEKKRLNVVLLGDHSVAREKEARAYFAQGDYHVVAGFLRKKIIYEKALDQGLSVAEVAREPYRQEALDLLEAISGRIEVVL